jgi:curved DNA-binding protein CbpA
LINFYEILGVHRNAGPAEIKNAFRKLAKQYHPDKNPTGHEHFEKVLKAYETLSQPRLKRTYDYKLEIFLQGRQENNQKQATTKTWKFDERELRRRKYYDEHIRKYSKATADYNEKSETVKSYNEFKYILYATPLAVALFLLIMKLARPENNKTTPPPVKIAEKYQGSKLNPGDAPYNSVFGNPVYDSANYTLMLKNKTGLDAIFCTFTENKFIRCFYLPDNYSAEVSKLPNEPLTLRYATGIDYKPGNQLQKTGIYGAFTGEITYYKSTSTLPQKSYLELDLLPGLNPDFEISSETEFFKLPTQ